MTHMHTKKIVLGFVLAALLMMALSTNLVAQEPVRVRPTVGPSGGGEASTDSDDSAGGAIDLNNCATVYGEALSWGVGGQRDIGLILGDGGWQVRSVTGENGYYNFGALGIGLGILKVDPGLTGLKPMIDEAAIPLTCDFNIQANIGLYSGQERPQPPGSISMQASRDAISAGETVEFNLTIRNSLPNPMSKVVVTDLLPEGLQVLDVTASAGSVEVSRERLATVIVGQVPQDSQVTIVISARAVETLPEGTNLTNTATLFYAESAADQATTSIEIQADTDRSMAAVAAAPPPSSETPQSTTKIAEADSPAEEFPEILPLTGVDMGISASILILFAAVIGLVIRGVHSARSARR